MKGFQEELTKALTACAESKQSTSVKCEIKILIDQDEPSQVKVFCKYKTVYPDRINGDTGIIVDDCVNTQTPVSDEKVREILLDFTGEKETVLKRTK